MHETPINPRVKFTFEGTFLSEYNDDTALNSLYFYLTIVSENGASRNISSLLRVAIADESHMDEEEEIERDALIHLSDSDFQSIRNHEGSLHFNFYTQLSKTFSMNLIYDHSPLDENLGLILGAVVLVGLYVLIVFELVHRTIAAIIASTLAIGRAVA